MALVLNVCKPPESPLLVPNGGGKVFNGRTYLRRPLIERMAEKINFLAPPPTNNLGLGSCWIWTGYVDKLGYGSVGIEGRKTMSPHRAMYQELIGSVPNGLELDHLCRNRACCNPWHLEPVTHAENIRRGMSPRMITQRLGVCKMGHPIEPKKRCKECCRITRNEWYAKNRVDFLDKQKKYNNTPERRAIVKAKRHATYMKNRDFILAKQRASRGHDSAKRKELHAMSNALVELNKQPSC